MKGSYPVLTTDAFILHTHGVGEADRSITALTRDRGLMYIYARSVRKEGAKMRGSVKPYGFVSLSVILSKRNILKDITITNVLREVWNNEEKYTTFVTLLRCIRSFIPIDDDCGTDIFSVVEETAHFLGSAHPAHATHALLTAQIIVLTILGYIPDQQIPLNEFANTVKQISSSPKQQQELRQHLKSALWYQ